MNEGDSPLDLPLQVMAGAINTTVSGKNVTHRPAYVRRPITYSTTSAKTGVEQGVFQGACDYLADNGTSSKVALISGRLFQFVILGTTVTCFEINIPNGVTNPNQPQAWLWQSEYFVIVNDGLSNPLFFDGRTNSGICVRSNYFPPSAFSTTTTSLWTTNGIPAPGTSDTISFTSVGAGPAALSVGSIVTMSYSPSATVTFSYGQFQVLAINVLQITLLNLTGTPTGAIVPMGATVQWVNQGTQLPPGRMGTYGQGRNWQALIDGKQFVAGDIVGGSSGTAANNFRDAVINITENLFLVGGGNFTVPGTFGSIRAMRFVATLDVSLGQGPLQVFTHDAVFSCNAPVDRLTWQTITNPILTQSLISSGALSQNSTILANGDAIFRSIDGARSLILARRDFDTWGNVPISFEVGPILDLDNPGLLGYTSSVVFDNRYLLTTNGIQDAQGVFFQGLVPLNFDPISSLRGKAPAVWDSGVWIGLNILQITGGPVEQVDRCFAFVLRKSPVSQIEFWEILPKEGPNSANFDNDGTVDIPIPWQFDSASLRFGVPKNDRKYMYLSNGETWWDNVVGTVTFDVFYKPDQYPCWTRWHNWQQCQNADLPVEDPFSVPPTTNQSQPGFIPRAGLGEPSPTPCDTSTNRPMRDGFTFQTRIQVLGHAVFLGAFFEANTKAMPKFAKVICGPLCQL